MQRDFCGNRRQQQKSADCSNSQESLGSQTNRRQRDDDRTSEEDEPLLMRSGPSSPSPSGAATTTATTTASSSTIEDIDRDDAHSTHCHVEYVDDVFANLRAGERRLQALKRALPDTMSRQRRQIVDWMCEVRARLTLRPDTLALGVALLDRYAYHLVAQRKSSSLRISIGASALMLASTLEEQFPPESRDFSFQCRTFTGDAAVCQRDLSDEQLRQTSWRVARTLDFDLYTPHHLHFLRRFSRASGHTSDDHNRAKRACEQALRAHADLLLPYPPSLIAAAAVMYVRKRKRPEVKHWTRTLRHYTGYRRSVVEAVEQILQRHVDR